MRATGSSTSPSCGSATRTWTRACKANGAPRGKTAAGSADLRGVMIRGAMPAIHRYLPLTVNPDAREWLATGLPAGEMRSAAITLKGDLDDFPYGAPGARE